MSAPRTRSKPVAVDPPASEPAHASPLPWEGDGIPEGREPDEHGQEEKPDQPAQDGKLPPHSPDAERAVLGCLLLSPATCVPQCVTLLKAGADVFYVTAHRLLYLAILSLWETSMPVDTVTLYQFLGDTHQLDKVGGLPYLAALPEATPSSENLEHYADIVLRKFTLRRMIVVCSDLLDKASAEPADVTGLAESASAAMQEVTDSTLASTTIRSAAVLCEIVAAKIEAFKANEGKITGLTTGFIDLDKMTWGLHPAEMFVIAARPSIGKTSLCINIADHVAVELKQPVGIFSLEMSDESLMLRCMCARAHVSMSNLRDGFLGQNDWPKLAAARLAIAKAPLFIDDSSGLSILQLRARARRMQQQYGISLFVIDYLQLMSAAVRRSDNRQHEVSEISKGLKGLAKELDVPVIVLSQLNRKIEERGRNAQPKLSDLRESGSVEQDADVVAMLYRPDKEENEADAHHSDAVNTNLLIAKSRNGPTGNVSLVFIRSWTRFESAAKISSEDVPDNQAGFVYNPD